jgi:hypothetical protein
MNVAFLPQHPKKIFLSNFLMVKKAGKHSNFVLTCQQHDSCASCHWVGISFIRPRLSTVTHRDFFFRISCHW